MEHARKVLNSMCGVIKIINAPIQIDNTPLTDDFSTTIDMLETPHLNRQIQLKNPDPGTTITPGITYDMLQERYDPTTNMWHLIKTKLNSQHIRGQDKPKGYRYTKKTSVSLYHPGRTDTKSYYGIESMVAALGLLFDVDELNRKGDRYVFRQNVVTNLKTTLTAVKGKKPPAYDHYFPFDQLKRSYVAMWQQGQTPAHWSEMLFCLCKEALIGIFEPKNHFSARINAIIRKQQLIKQLEISVPIIISNTQANAQPLTEHYFEYTQQLQWLDIFVLIYRAHIMNANTPTKYQQKKLATALFHKLDFSMLNYNEAAFNEFKQSTHIDQPNPQSLDNAIKQKIISYVISQAKMANNDRLLEALHTDLLTQITQLIIPMLQNLSLDEAASQCPDQIQTILTDPDFDISNYISMQDTLIQQHGYYIAYKFNIFVGKVLIKKQISNALTATAIKETYKIVFKALKATYEFQPSSAEAQAATETLTKIKMSQTTIAASSLHEFITSPDICKDYVESCQLLSAIANIALQNNNQGLYEAALAEWKVQISSDQADAQSNNAYFEKSPHPSQLAVVLLKHNKIRDLFKLPKAHQMIHLDHCLTHNQLSEHDFSNTEDQQILKQEIEMLLSIDTLNLQQWHNLHFFYNIYEGVDLAQQLFDKIQSNLQLSQNLLISEIFSTLKKLAEQIDSTVVLPCIMSILEHVNPSKLTPRMLLPLVSFTLEYPQKNLPSSLVQAFVADQEILTKIAIQCNDNHEPWTNLITLMNRLVNQAEADSILPLIIDLYKSKPVQIIKGRPLDIIKELLLYAPALANKFIDQFIIPNLNSPNFRWTLAESKDTSGFMFIHWVALLGHEPAVKAWLANIVIKRRDTKQYYLANTSKDLEFTWYYYHSAIFARQWALLESLLTSGRRIPRTALIEALGKKPQFSKAQAVQFPNVFVRFNIALAPSDRPKPVRKNSSALLQHQSSLSGSQGSSVKDKNDSDSDSDMTSEDERRVEELAQAIDRAMSSEADDDEPAPKPTSATATVGQARAHSEDEDDDEQSNHRTKRQRLQLFRPAKNDASDKSNELVIPF